MLRSTIEDPAPAHSMLYEGDLKYGRCESTPIAGKDFPANRDEKGIPKNRAAVELPLQQRRDPELWSKPKQKINKNKVQADPEAISSLTWLGYEYYNGLAQNISRITRRRT